MSDRLEVRKTYKLFIGGAFPRSESGRSEPVADAAGAHWANASRASRKDVRDAVSAAAKAFGGWPGGPHSDPSGTQNHMHGALGWAGGPDRDASARNPGLAARGGG